VRGRRVLKEFQNATRDCDEQSLNILYKKELYRKQQRQISRKSLKGFSRYLK
jgi:hypothetical protein